MGEGPNLGALDLASEGGSEGDIAGQLLAAFDADLRDHAKRFLTSKPDGRGGKRANPTMGLRK